MRKEDYTLIDRYKNEKIIYRMKVCAMISEIALIHGYSVNFNTPDEELISRYWNYDEYPPPINRIADIIKINNIKWYINNYIDVQNKVWNADYLHGLTKSGRIIQTAKSFPTFIFYHNNSIENILEECPFYGMRNNNWETKNHKKYYKWQHSPALILKHSDSSISYMAGVLSTGVIKYFTIDEKILNPKGRKVKTGKTKTIGYARFLRKLSPLFKKWNIPIEKRNMKFVYISPFWIALLTPWMPQYCQRWLNVKKPYKAKEYSLIMWKIFTGKDIKTDGIPYLISRRKYYYEYGTIKNLEKKWVDEKLVEIDPRFKEAVKKWDQGTV